MTHPDDEMSICAWIRRLTQNGNEVHISWTHSNAVREAEARAVAVLLGVPDRNLHFFGASDGSETGDDLAFVAKAREALGAGMTVFYSSWW